MSSVEILSLYFHIPFCVSRCSYCDFNTYAGLEGLIPEYVNAVEKEIGRWGKALGRRLAAGTVFFGGGTPSLLRLGEVERILGECRCHFNMVKEGEVTLESNPGDLSLGLLRGLLSLGVSRLSIGAQSLNDSYLKALGRRHSAQEAINSYNLARKAGFANVNLDLIYGLPGQSLSEWESTLKRATSMGPEHLSLYALEVEEGTPMWKAMRSGTVNKPDPDLASDMYVMAEELLEVAGYIHYEISNWAKPGRECLHNLTYWKNEPYLGFGAGAHSFFRRFRFSNVLRPRTYIAKMGELAQGVAKPIQSPLSQEAIRLLSPVRDVELIGKALEMAETMFLGLRLVRGVELASFAQRFGVEAAAVYKSQIGELEEMGLLAQGDGHLRLTNRGRLLGNEVFTRFLPSRT